jgi:hypothetical protein
MGTKAKLSTKVISIFLSALMALSCVYVALPGLAPKAAAADAELTAWQKLADAFTAAGNGGYMSTGDWESITSSAGAVTVTDGTTNGYAFNIVAALGELLALIGTGKHNEELRAQISARLASDYSLTLNEYQTAFLNKLLDTSGDYGLFSPSSIWNGTNEAFAGLTDKTLTITATRSEDAAILSDFDTIAEVAAADYAVNTSYSITITAKATKCDSDNNAETGAYYVNDTVNAAAVSAPISTSVKAQLQKIKEYQDYVTGTKFSTLYNPWYNNGGTVNTNVLYTYDHDEVAEMYEDFGEVYDAANTCDQVYIDEFIGAANMANHRTFANAAHDAITVIDLRDYVAWLVEARPFGGTTKNRDDYDTADPSSVEAVMTQASTFYTAVASVDSATLAILKQLYPTYDPDKAYNVDDTASIYANFPNYIKYLKSLMYNYYLQEIKAAATVLLNNGADTTYSFSNSTSKFFGLMQTAVGAGNYQEGSSYVLTSDTHVDREKTYYRQDATYTYSAAGSTFDENMRYYTNFYKVENPTASGLSSYYEEKEEKVYALTTDNPLKANKTYYVLYAPVEEPAAESIGTYFELVALDYAYAKTEDEEIVEGKTYYVLDGETYVAVDTPNVDDLDDYYERGEVTDAKYQQTADTELAAGKTYYTLTTDTYTALSKAYPSMREDAYELKATYINYVISTDTQLSATKTYYEQRANDYTVVASPSAAYIKNYAVRDVNYRLTKNTKLISGKTYYTYNTETQKYTVVTTPTVDNIGTYYETWIDRDYVSTSDTTLVSGKIYWKLVDGVYTEVEEPKEAELGSYYDIKYVQVANPVASYLYEYYEFVGTYYGLKGVGNGEYIEANYESTFVKTTDTAIVSGKTYYTKNETTGEYEKVTSPTAANLGTYYERAQCPINDTDLAALYTFFSNAVTMISQASNAGVRVSNYMDDVLVSQITEMRDALNTEILTRGRVDENFLEAYQPVADKLAGYIIGGRTIPDLYEDIHKLEASYTALTGSYSWFANDARGKAMKEFIRTLYAEVYDRVQEQYIEIFTEYKEVGSVTVKNYYQIKQNLNRLNDLKGYYNSETGESILTWLSNSYGADKVTGSNAYGARTNANLTKFWRNPSIVYNGTNSTVTTHSNTLDDITNGLSSFSLGTTVTTVKNNRFTKSSNIVRAGGWASDMARTSAQPFTVWFSTYNSSTPSGNKAKVSDTVTKLDNFLRDEDFVKLLGIDEQGKGITTLEGVIKDLLAEKLFSDKMMDTILGLLFPMLTKVFEEILSNMLEEKLQGLNLRQMTAGLSLPSGVNSISGTVWFYYNGYTKCIKRNTDGTVTQFTGGNPGGHLTNTFKDITRYVLELYIYPSTLGYYFQNITTSAGIDSADVTLLKAIGNAIATHDTAINQNNFREVNAWDYFLNSETGKYEFGFDWGLDSKVGFEAKYTQFKQMLGALFSSAIKILRALFGDQALTLSVDGNYGNHKNLLYGYVQDFVADTSVGDPSGSFGANNVKASVTINGVNLYKVVWIPLMEALGMNAKYNGTDIGSVFSYTIPSGTNAISGNFSGPTLAAALIDPVYELIKAVSNKPVESLCKLLPNLAFHLMNNSISNLLDIVINIHLEVTGLDVCEASGGAAAYIVQWDWVTNLIVDAFKDKLKFDIPVELGTLLNLEDLLGFSLTDLNTILAGIVGMIKEEATYTVTDGETEVKRLNLPGIGTGKLATAFVANGVYEQATTNGTRPNSWKRVYVSANVEGVFYLIFNWLFRAVQQDGGLADILALVEAFTGSSLGDSIPQLVYTLVEGIESADLAFAALIELLNEPEYDVFTFNWYQPNQHTTNWEQTPFTYLDYNNKWTESKAKYVYNNVDGIVNAVVNMITPDTLKDFDGDVNVWLDRTINSMFNNEGIMNVIEVVTKLGGMLASSPSIVKLLRQQITSANANDPEMNLYAWYNVWGYLYDDLHDVELGKNQFKAYNVQNNQVFIYEAVSTDEEADPNATITLQNVANSTAANAPYTWKIVQAYPAAPTENIPWLINGTSMSSWNHNAYYAVNGHSYNDYKNLFTNLRWTDAGTSEDGEILYTWEVKLTQSIISHLEDNSSAANAADRTMYPTKNGSTITGYYDNGRTYATGAWYPLIDGGELANPSSLNARAVFSAVFSELIGPFSNIFSFILSGKDLNLFGGNMTIQGYPAYNNAIMPFLEAIGVYGLKTQAEYDTLANSATTGGTRAAFDYLVNELFDAMDDLLTDDRQRDAQGNLVLDAQGNTIGKGAFQKLIDVLPHLFYFLQSDGLTVVLKNILMFAWQLLDTLRPIANIDLDNLVRTLLCRIMGYVYDDAGQFSTTPAAYKANELTAGLLDLLGMKAPLYTSATAERDADKVASIFQFSIKNLTLNKIWALVQGLTGLNLTPLTYALEGMIMTSGTKELNHNGTPNGPYEKTSYLVPKTADTYKTYTISFDGWDTITVTLSALIDILKYEGNAAALDKLAGTIANRLPGAENLLTGQGVKGLIQALVDIMDDQPYGDKVTRPNWDYIFEGKNLTGYAANESTWVNIVNTDEVLDPETDPNYSFTRWQKLATIVGNNFDFHNFHLSYMTNLQYLTSWTPEVADATTEVLSSVLDYVVSLLDLSDDFAEGTDLSTFSNVVDALLAQKVFTPALMIQLLDLLANVYTYLPDEILGVIDALLTDNAEHGAVVDMFAWRTAGYIVKAMPWYKDEDGVEHQYAAGAVDKDGNPIEEVWQANRNYDWFVAGNAKEIKDKTSFMNAFTALVEPAGTLFAYIFLGEDYNLLNSMKKNSANSNDSIVLNATNAYATALIPILEALGLDLTGYEPSKYINYYKNDNGDYTDEHGNIVSEENRVPDGTFDGSQFVDDLVTIIDTLFNDIIYGPMTSEGRKGGPVVWLLQNLPNIIYFINADGIKASIDNVFSAVNSVLNAIATVVDLPVDLHNIMDSGLDLTNLTFDGVFGMIYTLTKSYNEDGTVVPGLYLNNSLREYIGDIYIGKIEPFTSANGYRSFRMVYSNDEDASDMVTILLALALEYITDSGSFPDSVDNHGNLTAYNNATTLDRLLFSGTDYEGVIGEVIAALRNPASLTVTEMDWNYFNHDFNLSSVDERPVTVPYYAFQYLNWTTEWTYTKAETAANEFETLVFQALKMLVPSDPSEITAGSLIEKIAAAESLGDILSIDFIFTADILNSILDFVSGLLYGEDSILNADMVKLIGYILGGDLTQWNGSYAFTSEEPEVGDFVTEKVKNENNQEVDKITTITAVNGSGTEDGMTYYDVTRTVQIGSEVSDPKPVRLYLIESGEREQFVAGFVKVLDPLAGIRDAETGERKTDGLLGWLLFGQSYTFFNPHDTTEEYLITLEGSQGYKNGLVLLLEALGCDSYLKYSELYVGHADVFVADLVNSIAERAELICQDPVNELVGLIPEIIYFINAGGLAKTVTGLLSGPLGLVKQVSSLAPMIQRLLKLPASVTSVSDETGEYALVEKTIDSVIKSLLAKNDYTVTLNDDGTTDIDFSLTGINLKYIFNLLEVITGMEISDVIGNKLDTFAIGAIHAYGSKAGSVGAPALAYKMSFAASSNQGTNDSFADFITILLSAVVDLIEYKQGDTYVNAEALAALLKLDGDKAGLVVAIAKLLQSDLNANILPIDWFYFSSTLSRYTYDPDTRTLTLKNPVPELSEGSLDTLPPKSSVNYLTYASDWTEDTSEYIFEHFSEIINGVLGMFVKDEDTGAGKTLSDIINDNFTLAGNVFTYENYNKVITTVSGLASKIPGIVNTLLNIALELDLSSLGNVSTLTEAQYNALSDSGKQNAFVSAIISIVTPLRPIIEWFFFGQSLEYFDKDTNTANVDPDNADIEKLISMGGYNGYRFAIVPLLEAIGVVCPKYTVSASDTVAQRNEKFGNFISVLVENVLARMEEILQDPADAIINLLPNVIYFLNTNGLATVLNNLVAPLVAVINDILPAIASLSSDLAAALEANNITTDRPLTIGEVIKVVLALFNSEEEGEGEGEEAEPTAIDFILTNVNFNKLDLVEILRIAEGLLASGLIKIKTKQTVDGVETEVEEALMANLKLVDVVGAEKIDNFYLNDIQYFASAYNDPAFRMPGSADMITVFINYLLEVVLYKNGEFSNAAELDKLLGGDTVTTIVNLIYGIKDAEADEPEKLNWNYFDGSQTLGDGITVPYHTFVYLEYNNQWTFEKAVYLDNGLEDLLAQVLSIAGVADGDISALIEENLPLADYLNAESLNTIIGFINGLFNGGSVPLPEALLNVVGLILNMDLSKWDGKYAFVDAAAEGASVQTSTAYDLDYYEADGKTYYIIDTTENFNDFASGLQLILEPAQSLLGWLLLGDSFGFFVPSATGNVDDDDNRLDEELIRVPGANGYDTGLVLLLEALGCKNLKAYTEYEDISLLVKDVIVSVLNRLTEILDDPINEILPLIPEIIYFINAGGLGATVQNFAGVLLAIVNEVLKSGLLDSMVNGDLKKYLTPNNDGTNGPDEDYNGTYKVDLNAIVNDLLKTKLADKWDDRLTFDFDNVNLQYVINVVEVLTGLEIDDVVGYTLDKFVIGVVQRYNSVSTMYIDKDENSDTYNKSLTYKLVFTPTVNSDNELIFTRDLIGQTRADMITILLSLAIDLLDMPSNVTALVTLINGFIEDPAKKLDEATVNAILTLLKGVELGDYQQIDWFYFDDDYSIYDENGALKTGDDVPTVDYTTTIDTPARTINYIEYYTDWTKEDAQYLVDNIDEIIAEVFDLIPGMSGKTVADLLAGYFTLEEKVYNKELFEKIVNAVQGIVTKYGDVLVNTVGLVLGADLRTLAAIDLETLDVSTKENFAAALVQVLEPVYVLLNWLLFGENMYYFYDNEFYRNGGGAATEALYDDARDLISLTGAEGYKYGLVPLLEALGVTLPELPEAGKLVAGDTFLYDLLVAVLTRVEDILADPVNEVLALLPELLYFINAGGLSASIFNLIHGIYGLLPQISGLLDTLGVDLVINGTDFSSLDVNVIVNSLLANILPENVTLDVTHIDLMAIVSLIEAATGLAIEPVVTRQNIRYFYFGKLEAYESRSGETAFKMVYSTKEGKAEMLTLLVNFLVEVALYKDEANEIDNVATLAALLKLTDGQKDKLETIIELLTGETDIFNYTYGEMEWNYFDGTVNVATVDIEGNPVPGSITVPTSQYIYLEYANDWTVERADGIDKNLAALVDGVIGIIKPGATTVSDLLNGYYEEYVMGKVFTADNLNAILGFLQGFLYGDDSVIGQHLAELAGLVLGGDITGWNRTYSFADYDESAAYVTDAAVGLRYTAEEGIKEYAIETEEDFINGLYLILKPASNLLGWLLLGNGYNFFAFSQGNYTDETKPIDGAIINIPGTDAYGNALALLLEALGVEGLGTSASYNGDAAKLLKDILTGLVNRIDDILRDPVNEVLDLLPELIYFINANGLGVVVSNLVQPLVNAVNAVNAQFNIVNLIGADKIPAGMYNSDTGELKVIEFVEAYITNLLNSYTTRPVEFKLNEVNTGWAVDLIEKLTDLQIMAVLGTDYPISKFILGTPTEYDTVSNFDVAYKIALAETASEETKYQIRCDLITIVLSLAIEMLEIDHNQVVIEDEFKLTAGIIADVLTLIKNEAIQITPDYEWFYFDEGASFDGTDITLTTPERTINYLKYTSNWDEDFADYVDDHLNSIIAAVLGLLPDSETKATVQSILNGEFRIDDKLYTAENLNKIVDAIKGLVGQLNGLVTSAVAEEADNEFLADALNLIFDIDLHAWDDMTFEDAAVSDKFGFAAALAEIVSPLENVINWLFFGSKLALFNHRYTDTGDIEDILVINGYDGYNEGLVPLLEALGVDLTGVSALTNVPAKIEKIVVAALTRVEAILADPVEQVLALLPEIFYFINTNGLAASVNHLLGAPLILVKNINALLADLGVELTINDTEYNQIDIDGLLNNLLNKFLTEKNLPNIELNTKKLDLVEIVKIVEVFTGLELVDVVTEDKLDNFYLGQISSYPSANGKTLFKMGYTDDAQKDRADMITVLFNFAVEAALYGDNTAVIESLAKLEPGTIKTFLDALKTLSGEDYAYDWNYFYGEEPEETEGQLGYDATFDRYETPEVQFGNYLTYKSDWTKSLANDLYNNLDTIINTVLAMTGNEASNLGEIINKNFTLYKGEYLNKVLELVQKLYTVLTDDVLIGVIDEFLDIDLTYWRDLSFDEEKTYTSTEFAAAIVEMVQPIYSVIDWLFFGKDITLFLDNATGNEKLIVIDSVDAYATGLVPVLEALDVKLPAYDGSQKCATVVTYNGVEMSFFGAIVNAILDRVNAILTDPIPEALELLPELLYFVNANGLSTAVYNMLGGVIDVVNTLIAKNLISLDGAETVQAYVLNAFKVDVNKLDLVGIFNYVENIEALHGLKLNDVFTGDFNNDGVAENILEYFYIGDYANAYTSSAAGFKGYKLSLDEENKGDLLTMLLSVVLEVILYEDNAQPITDIIHGFNESFNREKFDAIKLLLTTGIQTNPEMLNINWVYFWNYSEEQLQAKITEVLNAQVNNVPEQPLERTKNALKYGGNEGVQNLWNTGVREYLNANLESIVDLAIQMATKDSDTPSNSLSDLLQNNLDIWSDDTANALLGYLTNALSRVDDVLIDTVGSLLGAGQLSALKNAEARGIESKEDFVDFFVETLSPLSNVLDFVLFGGDYEFFTHLEDGEPATIVLKGGEGYKYGLAPILAALGVDTEISEEKTEVALREVLTNLTDRIDDILYGGDTIDEALKLLLNVIYFINADGISISIKNLLAPIDALLKEVNEILLIKKNDDGTPAEFTVNSLITNFDLEGINFDFLFNLLLDKTGINADDPIGSYIRAFYFGTTEYFTSYGNLGNFRMVYTEDENRIDMITIIVTLLLDVVAYRGNHDALVGIVKQLLKTDDTAKAENYVNTIVALLQNNDYRVPMYDYEWAYMDYADTHTVISAYNGLTGDSIFGTGLYGPLYTRDMGAYISKWLPLCIDTYLVLLGVKNKNGDIYRSLDDILNEYVGPNIYTNEILQSIGSAITGALAGIKEKIGEEMFNHIVNVLKASLDVDLNNILYGRVATIQEGNQEQFIQAICDLLAPAAPLLKWLLSDTDIALFNHDVVVNAGDTYHEGDDYIILKGAKGYENAIIPILEALRVGDSTGIKTQAEYNALDGADMIKYILTPIFDRLNTILDNPMTEIFRELPAVVYFLNSNGLDTAVKNLLNAVYSLLYAVEPLIKDIDGLYNSNGEIDLLALVGIELKNINIDSLLTLLINKINANAEFDLTGVIGEAMIEFTMGTVDSFTSKRIVPEALVNSEGHETTHANGVGTNAIDYTMNYSTDGAGGDKVDYVSVLLRMLLKFISIPQNVTAIEKMLKGKLNDDGYKFLCSLLENFSQMAATDDGMDKIMYTFYYIFYAALNAGVATNNGLARFNGDYSFLNSLFKTSQVGFLRQLEISLGDLLNKYTPEVVNDHEVAPQGQISFWQKIINFFKKIGDFFRNLFSR